MQRTFLGIALSVAVAVIVTMMDVGVSPANAQQSCFRTIGNHVIYVCPLPWPGGGQPPKNGLPES